MAIYRNVQMSFWTDAKVVDDFTPEDKYFYLYLCTNPHTTLAGCYEISLRQMSSELGYSMHSVENLLERFENVHKVIRFSPDTKEVLLLNWHKYNWTDSDKFKKALHREIESVKNPDFKRFLTGVAEGDDTVSIPYPYGMDTTVTVTVTDPVLKKPYPYKEIIEYLNEKAGTAYRAGAKDTQSHIRARFEDGFTLEDFRTVIDKKCAEWKGTEMEKYLRPATLFGTKFESYLNQHGTNKRPNSFSNFEQSNTDWDDLAYQIMNQ